MKMRQFSALCAFILLSMAILATSRPTGQSTDTVRSLEWVAAIVTFLINWSWSRAMAFKLGMLFCKVTDHWIGLFTKMVKICYYMHFVIGIQSTRKQKIGQKQVKKQLSWVFVLETVGHITPTHLDVVYFTHAAKVDLIYVCRQWRGHIYKML